MSASKNVLYWEGVLQTKNSQGEKCPFILF